MIIRRTWVARRGPARADPMHAAGRYGPNRAAIPVGRGRRDGRGPIRCMQQAVTVQTEQPYLWGEGAVMSTFACTEQVTHGAASPEMKARAQSRRSRGNQRAISGQSTGNQRVINGQSTGNQRVIKGQSPGTQARAQSRRSRGNQRTINRQSTDNQREINGQSRGNHQKRKLVPSPVVDPRRVPKRFC